MSLSPAHQALLAEACRVQNALWQILQGHKDACCCGGYAGDVSGVCSVRATLLNAWCRSLEYHEVLRWLLGVRERRPLIVTMEEDL